MELIWSAGADLVAIAILTLVLYYPRHHRRDLVTAFIVVNVGVFSVSIVLADLDIGLGVGLGLFGVLSIIRLRSSEISQHEVAYYFASLALGLITGLPGIHPGYTLGLSALLVCAIALVDSRLLLRRSRQQTLRLDGADVDLDALSGRIEPLIGAPVKSLSIERVDYVDDVVVVNVRWSAPRPASQPRRRNGGAEAATESAWALQAPAAGFGGNEFPAAGVPTPGAHGFDPHGPQSPMTEARP